MDKIDHKLNVLSILEYNTKLLIDKTYQICKILILTHITNIAVQLITINPSWIQILNKKCSTMNNIQQARFNYELNPNLLYGCFPNPNCSYFLTI
jgi:hypothetical protein